MPLYIDHHKTIEGATAQAVAEDHKKDLEVQHKHGVKTLRYWFSEDKGEVYCLFEAPNAEAAEAVEGRGLLGARYERGAGTFSSKSGRGYDLTLVEAEALEELSARGVELASVEARRNLVVRGIALDDLIGRRFRVGEVECLGQRRCEPCAHLERLTQPGVLRSLVHRGGLRADVLSGGRIRTGDRVEAVA